MFRLLWSLAVVSLVTADTLYFEPGQSQQRGQLRSRTVICPDQKSTCADGTTCCKLTTGQYGCCPMPKAVCCSDHQHCCPAGHKCDVAEAKCLDGSGQARPWLQKTLSQPLTYVICPGGQYQCPNSNTCCKSRSGDWGCCPFPNAACCTDGQHCCPRGYKCDLGHGTCVKSGAANVLLGSMQEAPKVDTSSTRAAGAGGQKLKVQTKNAVKCPDGSSTCPDGTTCCKMQSGAYGCCPFPNAVCCADHLHCCEDGQTCDIEKGSCNSAGKTTTWLRKIPATTTNIQGGPAVVCPDKTTCPSGNTCCELGSNAYGCCPLAKAVCCSDHDHCCPAGYSCDVGTSKCIHSVNAVPWSSKQPAQPVGSTYGSNMCPDRKSMCPDGSTCCKMGSGSWGCCPMAHAVCCSDGEHCCPPGTTCDVGAGTCNALTSSLSITSTRLRAIAKVNVNNLILKQPFQIVKCDDGTQCPDGSTCCKMTSGKFACCSHSKAQCCEDKVHCCPQGFTCPPKGKGECQKGSVSISWSFFARSHARAPEHQPQAESVICPDSTVECPKGNTCCPMADGGFGCCALPDAVCCKGGVCCPKTSECDATGKRCLQTVPWLSKTPSRRVEEELTMPCPGSNDRCPVDSTCCKAYDGSWGCCASPEAVCCSNGRSCCPKGMVCSDEPGACVPPKGSTSAQRAAAFLRRAVKGGHILY